MLTFSKALLDTPKATPISTGKLTQYLQGYEHKEQVALLSNNKSLKMAGSMTSPPGQSLDSHNPILPHTATTDYMSKGPNAESHFNDTTTGVAVVASSVNSHFKIDPDSSERRARRSEPSKSAKTVAVTSQSDGSKPSLRRGSGASNTHKAGSSHSGQPDLRAASLAAATIKALQDLSEARRPTVSAPDIAPVNATTSLSHSQAPTDENIQSILAPYITATGHQFGPHPPQPMHPAMSTFSAFPPGLGYSPQLTPQMIHSPGLNNLALHHHSQTFGATPSRTPGIENHHQSRHSPAHSFHANTPVLHEHPEDNTGRNFSQDVFTGPPMPPKMTGDSLDGLAEYIQMQFNNPAFADLQLEVRFPAKDGKQSLIQIPGHSMFFARSPCLGQLMAAGFTDVKRNGMPSRAITLDLDDGYIRPTSFWMALQRLYGGPLLTRDTMPNYSTPAASDSDPEAERFDLALGYAAAGHILQMEPVVRRGAQAAGHHLQWNSLVKALDFADAILDPEVIGGAMDDGRTGFSRKYGPACELLIPAILEFITERFPVGFELDITAADPEQIRRLPKPNTFFKKHNQKLSAMRFGEFGLDDDVSDADIKESQPNSSSSSQVILSSVLLNLPFPLLKHVLESQSLGVAINGGLDAAQRAQTTTMVVKERERRRVQALKNWQHRLLSASQLMGKRTETQQEKTLWWLESVFPCGGALNMTRELMRSPFGHELPA